MPRTARTDGLRGRPRDASKDGAIIDAATRIVEADGYQALSFERLAAASGIAKATIYRRYRCRGEIAVDALVRFYASAGSAAERPRLEDYIRSIYGSTSQRTAMLLKGIVADAAIDPVFAEVLRKSFILPRREIAKTIIATDPETAHLTDEEVDYLIDLIFGPGWYRMLIGHADLDDRLGKRVVATVRAYSRALKANVSPPNERK